MAGRNHIWVTTDNSYSIQMDHFKIRFVLFLCGIHARYIQECKGTWIDIDLRSSNTEMLDPCLIDGDPRACTCIFAYLAPNAL